jgi:hypothetical protein
VAQIAEIEQFGPAEQLGWGIYLDFRAAPQKKIRLLISPRRFFA